MTALEAASNVVRLEDWAWRRPRRPRTLFQRHLGQLEPMAKDAILHLMDVFEADRVDIWRTLADSRRAARDGELHLPAVGTPLAEFGDDALITLTLEAGYTLGDATTFKAVLPYFLAATVARPLESWVVDPDLLRTKLETLSFESWPLAERRCVARALAVYAQHEIDLADREPGDDDEVLVATKNWAEHALASAL